MIIVKIQGGLGNQMFQYAFARTLAKESGQPFAMDMSGFDPLPGVTPRSYRLKEVFGIDVTFAKKEQVTLFLQEKNTPTTVKLKRLFGKKIPLYIRERNLDKKHNLMLLAQTNDIYFDGDWHSEKYFLGNGDEIRSLFNLPSSKSLMYTTLLEEIMAADKKGQPSVSLQIRRGDYVTNQKIANTLGAQSNDYYERALHHIAEKVGGSIHVFVLSDDIDWVKQNLKIPYPVTYVTRPAFKDYEEMSLMSKCKYHVISNSSFGWWGAWLDPRPEKIVITPKVWFKDSELNTDTIVPTTWIQL